MAKMISAKSDVEERLGQRADTGPGALHVAGDNQKVGCVARQAVNGRGYHYVAGGKPFHQLAKLRPVGRGAGDFLAEHFFASAAFSWRTCPVSSWAAVETRA
jgi:hypothetical protein